MRHRERDRDTQREVDRDSNNGKWSIAKLDSVHCDVHTGTVMHSRLNAAADFRVVTDVNPRLVLTLPHGDWLQDSLCFSQEPIRHCIFFLSLFLCFFLSFFLPLHLLKFFQRGGENVLTACSDVTGVSGESLQ